MASKKTVKPVEPRYEVYVDLKLSVSVRIPSATFAEAEEKAKKLQVKDVVILKPGVELYDHDDAVLQSIHKG